MEGSFHPAASRETDSGGNLCHGQEVQVEADEGNPGTPLSLQIHHGGHVRGGCHPQRACGELAIVRLSYLIPLQR